MTHEELTQRIEALIPLVNHKQAEHYGAHYFSFKGDEGVVKRVCWAACENKKVTRPAARVSVHLDGNDLEYRIHISNGRYGEDFITGLEEIFAHE